MTSYLQGFLVVLAWFIAVGTTGYIWGSMTTLAANSIKTKRVCDLCFRNIKEWNKVYHDSQKSAPTNDTESMGGENG